MEQYLVFAGDLHYPSGGWDDFRKSFSTKEDAIADAARFGPDWWHVVDARTGAKVAEGGS